MVQHRQDEYHPYVPNGSTSHKDGEPSLERINSPQQQEKQTLSGTGCRMPQRQRRRRGGLQHPYSLTASNLSFYVVVLFLWLSHPKLHIHGQNDFSCQIQANDCPSDGDGVCDNTNGGNPKPGCEDHDCGDCDSLCTAFNYDCLGCLSNGCYWCPGDALCSNSNLYLYPGQSCMPGEGYIQGVATPADFCPGADKPFNDPLYAAQEWIYDMIDVQPVWARDIFGTGVRMRINDSGMNSDHVEFDGRFDVAASCSDFEARDGHGTYVAGIAAAARDNGECSVGIAPDVTLSACFALVGNDWIDVKVNQFDIAQNSIGVSGCEDGAALRRLLLQRNLRRLLEDPDIEPRQLQTCPFTFEDEFQTFPCEACDFTQDIDLLSDDCVTAIADHCTLYYEEDPAACLDYIEVYVANGECQYNELTADELSRFLVGINQGRDGKGIIYVFASGNDYTGADDVNFSGYTNTRFTISVGSVDKTGLHASYSNPGAALFVSAPGGDFDFFANFATTDLDGGCSDAGQGTSFACPVVSGVIALMLEVNPDLTWRDVQGVLATTSTPVTSDPDDNTQTTNGAGLWHSNFYGFGIVNADRAVTAAETWTLYEQEINITVDSGLINIPIPDNSNAITSTVQVTADSVDSSFVAESVEAMIDLRHFTRGDLDVVLTSPQGTRSVLAPGKRPERTQTDVDERWDLVTVKAWGESPFGSWTLRLADVHPGDLSTCADHLWHINVGSSQQRLTCSEFESFLYCSNGAVDMEELGGNAFVLDVTDDDGLTAEEACCACGGGRTRTDDPVFVDELVQWTLVVYGRSRQAVGEPSQSPSDHPSQHPSLRPSERPSQSPSERPSQTPSEVGVVDSAEPSNKPSQQPSKSPSHQPSAEPSALPNGLGSASPTGVGSAAPTGTGSAFPSQKPSDMPSSMPNTTPTSAAPTMTQSGVPSSLPSSRPSSLPSPVPSSSPAPTHSAPTVQQYPIPHPPWWTAPTGGNPTVPQFPIPRPPWWNVPTRPTTPQYPIPRPPWWDPSLQTDDQHSLQPWSKNPAAPPVIQRQPVAAPPWWNPPQPSPGGEPASVIRRRRRRRRRREYLRNVARQWRLQRQQ